MDDRLVSMGSYGTAFAAQMDKNILEMNGIAACVTEEVSFFGSVNLLVPEPDVPRAELILAAARGEPNVNPEDEEPSSEDFADSRTCQQCGESFAIELARCPRCVTSDAISTNQPEHTGTNLAPLGPDDEVKDAPYSRGDEYASRAIAISLVMFFFSAGASTLVYLYAGTLFHLFGEPSLPLVMVASLIALLIQFGPPLYVGYLIIRFFIFDGELRKSSEYKVIGAILINGVILCLAVLAVIRGRS
jgi:hypothetical protein